MILNYNRESFDIILNCLFESICHLGDEQKIAEIQKKCDEDLDILYKKYFGDWYE